MLTKKKELGLQMYLEGQSLSSISKQIGINRLTLTNYLKKSGLTIINPSKKYEYNKSYFSIINSEEKAYWLGFIYADGCINVIKAKNGQVKSMNLEITLKESDREHLVKFAKSLNAPEDLVKSKIVKLNGKSIQTYRIVVCSTEMCRDLIALGATPRKSLKLKFPKNLPSNLIRHFIRGYFDGDGCINTSNNRKRISLLGTKEFLQDVQLYFSDMGVTCTKISHGNCGKSYYFEKSGLQVINILNYLYKDSSIYLDRKYKKAIAVLTQSR